MKEDTKEGNTEGSNERTVESHIIPFQINNILILNGTYPCTEQIDMISIQHMQVYTCIKVYYTQRIPPTCFGYSCGYPQGSALQRMDTSKY